MLYNGRDMIYTYFQFSIIWCRLQTKRSGCYCYVWTLL